MAQLHFSTRDIVAKIVYFGATGAGCNTSVRRLYDCLPARERSGLHRFGAVTSDEVSWYFDYAPVDAPVLSGFALRLQVVSLPGGVDLDAHRDQLLEDLDAVVFVADARQDKDLANVDSLIALERALALQGVGLGQLCAAIQVNQGDREDSRLADAVAADLNPYGFPVFSAVAAAGEGLREAHVAVVGQLVDRLRGALAGEPSSIRLAAKQARPLLDDVAVRQLMESIRAQIDGGGVFEAREEHRADDEGPVVEIAFTPRDELGARPLEVLSAAVEGDRILVHLLMDPIGGGELHRLTLALRPELSMRAYTPEDDADAFAPSSADADLSAYLPEQVDWVTEDAPPMDGAAEALDGDEDGAEGASDAPGWAFGLFGLAAGLVIGLMLGYLMLPIARG
jgi:hypothetical protein